MRSRLYFTIVLVLVPLGFIAARIYAFVQLFFEHAGIAITQEEIAFIHNTTVPDQREQLIPKIIHNVFHNWQSPGDDTMPADWDDVRKSCVTQNPDWEYKVRRAG
jgi:mannosyltransferase OCH1-like enzyme